MKLLIVRCFHEQNRLSEFNWASGICEDAPVLFPFLPPHLVDFALRRPIVGSDPDVRRTERLKIEHQDA